MNPSTPAQPPTAQPDEARRDWDTPTLTRHDLVSVTLADPGGGTDAGQADQFS